uniref:Uncharacterized protein n=2 Tax=Oryza sativa subsp. japonica TaxID=39947 RepID=Q10HE4_ORYSJ|nr:hypothetical protein [Oryza sativa Japonica Group]ABF97399.1 retrotransposon protein, putative, Ty3-gypsy subclass [Oryza sativa Japonica Group]
MVHCFELCYAEGIVTISIRYLLNAIYANETIMPSFVIPCTCIFADGLLSMSYTHLAIIHQRRSSTVMLKALADLFSFDIKDYFDETEEETTSKALAPWMTLSRKHLKTYPFG